MFALARLRHKSLRATTTTNCLAVFAALWLKHAWAKASSLVLLVT